MARYRARYYDGRTARAWPVEIEVAATGLAVFSDEGRLLAVWPGAEVRLADRPGRGEPARLGLEGSMARLVVEDRGVLRALETAAPELERSQRITARGAGRLALWASLAVASVAGIVFLLVPLFAAQLAAVTPASTKFALGRAALDHLALLLPEGDRNRRYCAGEAGQAALARLAESLAADLPERPRLQVVVMDTSLVNAFAMPGGIVMLTRALIDEARSADEVAGVLAHEIGHVAHDHGAEALYRSVTVSLLVGVLLGDLTGGALAGGLAEAALNSSYSREAERDADAFALDRLEAAGVGAHGLAAFLTRLAEREPEDRGLLRILASHPPTDERLAGIRNAPRQRGRPAMSEADWRAVRAVCERLQKEPPLD